LCTTAAILGRLRITRSSFAIVSTSLSLIRATRSALKSLNAARIPGHFASTTRQLMPAWNTGFDMCSR